MPRALRHSATSFWMVALRVVRLKPLEFKLLGPDHLQETVHVRLLLCLKLLMQLP